MPADVIAIDGPAGSGKSTTARAVAQALGFAHLDSGALYRAVTWLGLRMRSEFTGRQLAELAREQHLGLVRDDGSFVPVLGKEPIGEVLRSPEVTRRVSAVAALPEVRDWVNRQLREAAAGAGGVVSDGRDIGTVVFPEARLKVFLTASPEERARRRFRETGEAENARALRRMVEDLEARDRADSERAVAPLRPAEGAVRLDTGGLRFEEQVGRIVVLARKAFPQVDLQDPPV